MGSIKILKVEILKVFLSVIYWLCLLLPSYKKNAILLLSSRSNHISVGMGMLQEELVKDKNLKVTTFFYDRGLSQAGLVKNSMKAVYLIARSHVIVVDDHCVPLNALYCKHQRNVVIQIWHAAGAFKKFGNLKDTKTRIPHKNYDVVCVNAKEDVAIYAEALGVKESQVKVTGSLQLSYVKCVYDSLPAKVSDSLTIFYAPTYRSGWNHDISLQGSEHFIRTVKNSNPGFQVKVSIHPYLRRYISQYPLVEDHLVSKENFYADLLNSDVLVTDYSSLIYDYSYTEKSILFLTPDKASYMKDNGLINTDVLQGSSCFTDEIELLNHIALGEANREYSRELKKKIFNEKTSAAKYEVMSIIKSAIA